MSLEQCCSPVQPGPVFIKMNKILYFKYYSTCIIKLGKNWQPKVPKSHAQAKTIPRTNRVEKSNKHNNKT